MIIEFVGVEPSVKHARIVRDGVIPMYRNYLKMFPSDNKGPIELYSDGFSFKGKVRNGGGLIITSIRPIRNGKLV